MYVAIDNTANDAITLHFFINGAWDVFVFNQNDEQAFLLAIESFLRERGVGPEAIKGLAVRVGVGRFTATRVAVTAANMFALLLQIPVATFTEFHGDAIIESLRQAEPGRYVAATYSAEASVGKKKE